METKHTPGPWQEYNSQNGRIFNSWRVQDARGELICTLKDRAGDVNVGNARLIAAAPDLLAACQRLIDIESSTQSAICGYCHVHHTKHTNGCPVKLATAAIARATGEKERVQTTTAREPMNKVWGKADHKCKR